MKSALFAIALLTLTAIGICCYSILNNEQITGKVLIVQKNADVKKLALIEIYAVSETDVERWKAKINDELRHCVDSIHSFQGASLSAESEIRDVGDKRMANSAASIQATKEAVEVARRIWLIDRKSETLRKRFRELVTTGSIPRNLEFVEMAKAENWQDAYTILSNSALPEAERINRAASSDYKKQLDLHRKVSREKLSEMIKSLDDLIPAPKVNSLPEDVNICATDVTDETGSFKLKVKRGNYYIFAEGSRSTGAQTEHYFWAHPVEVPSQESQKCLIGNLNLNGESTNRDDLWHELRKRIADQKRVLNP
jgi:hypothetical protein